MSSFFTVIGLLLDVYMGDSPSTANSWACSGF